MAEPGQKDGLKKFRNLPTQLDPHSFQPQLGAGTKSHLAKMSLLVQKPSNELRVKQHTHDIKPFTMIESAN